MISSLEFGLSSANQPQIKVEICFILNFYVLYIQSNQDQQCGNKKYHRSKNAQNKIFQIN